MDRETIGIPKQVSGSNTFGQKSTIDRSMKNPEAHSSEEFCNPDVESESQKVNLNPKSHIDIPISYEDKRKLLRYGKFFTLLLIFKSTVGICYFNYHYAIAKCGFLLAMFLNVITCYLTTYGLYKITRLADLIEKKAQEEEGTETMIRVYHELPEIMKTPGAPYLKYIILCACVMMTGGSNIGNLSMVSTMMALNLGVNLYLVKLVICIFFCALMFFIVEPEKIKGILLIVTVTLIVMVIMVITHSVYMIVDPSANTVLDPRGVHLTYANWVNMGLFLGVSSYAFESIGSIFNVRRTMKDRTAMPGLQIWAFIFIAISYYVTGLCVYLAYGDYGMKPTVFMYYSWAGQPVMYCLSFIYAATCVFNIPFNVIAFVENFEILPCLKNTLSDRNGDLSRWKLTFFRILVVVVSMAITLITDNVATILGICGSLAAPLISYILPMVLWWQFVPTGNWWKFHDCTVIGLGLVCAGFGLYSSLTYK
jgi:hypothetical protein